MEISWMVPGTIQFISSSKGVVVVKNNNSTKTVVEKLSFNKFPTKVILNVPEDVDDFKEVEYDTSIKKDQYDLIFVFIFSLDEFRSYLKEVVDKNLLKENGYLYFAYPKKNNKTMHT